MKSVPMPITSSGAIPAASTACGTAVRRTSRPQDVEVVGRHLQRPLRRQGPARHRQNAVHHAVAVVVHRGAELGAVTNAHNHRAPRQRAEVDAHHTRVGMDRLVSHEVSVIANIPPVKMLT
ncbi:hypothetical protein [Lentzea aerocolonigenes]|uniref:hypothetical protein n=1 Tax=Lentzea aerocolonigenes TaxID=68170 RepID=UPI003AF78E63